MILTETWRQLVANALICTCQRLNLASLLADRRCFYHAVCAPSGKYARPPKPTRRRWTDASTSWSRYAYWLACVGCHLLSLPHEFYPPLWCVTEAFAFMHATAHGRLKADQRCSRGQTRRGGCNYSRNKVRRGDASRAHGSAEIHTPGTAAGTTGFARTSEYGTCCLCAG